MQGQIEIKSFSGWLSNDKNAWQEGAFYDCVWVDVRKNLSHVKLARAVTELNISTTNKINVIALTNYNGGTVDQEVNAFTDNGYIYSNDNWEVCRLHDKSTGSLRTENIQNVVFLKSSISTSYYYVIGRSYIYRFQNRPYAEILATNTFASGWTGTNWSFTSGATHTTGSTTALTQSSPLVSVVGEVYHIVCDLSAWFAGTLTTSIGWATSSNLVAGRNDVYLRATTTAGVSFTPSSTYNGTINYVRVERVSDLASSDGLWMKQMFTRSITTADYAPAIIWGNWDIIYGAGNSVSRINKDGTHMEYSSTLEQSVIWGLQWTVRSITQVGNTVYVWCNDGGNTNIYLWDGITSRPTEKITIPDRPVINCASLNNEHYWWTQKGVGSQKYAFHGAGYQNLPIIKSDVPRDPTAISSFATGNIQTYEQDRLALYWENTNAIETFGDIIYLPGYGKLFGFGKYYPNQDVTLDKNIIFNGGECTAMLTTTTPTLWQDYTFYMFIAYKRSSTYYVGKIDMREWNGGYTGLGYIDTIEYMSPSSDTEMQGKKYTLRFNLPHSSTSIKVYRNVNRAGFTLHKTINTTDYSTGINVAEVSDEWSWDTIQWRFELISSNSTYTPELYIGFKSKFEITERK